MADLQRLKVRGQSQCNRVYANEFVGGLTGVADVAIYDIEGNPIVGTYVNKTSFVGVGDKYSPVYFDADGKPQAIVNSLEVTVPRDAKFTDTITTVELIGEGNVIVDVADNGKGVVQATKGIALTEHPEISTSTDSSTTVRPPLGNSFNTISDIIKDENGHIVKLVKQKVVMPTITISDENVAQEVSNTTDYKPVLLGDTDTNVTSHVLKANNVRVSPQLGIVQATTFEGNLDGYAIRSYGDEYGDNIAQTYAPLDSPAFVGNPTVPPTNTEDNSNRIATTSFVQSIANSLLAKNDAMLFKGVIDQDNLPADAEVGWTYKVLADGTYANQKCEVGDLLVYAGDGEWVAVQTNIDGAVTSKAKSVDGNIVIFEGTSGKAIKDSGLSIATSVPENAVFTDTTNTVGATQSSEIIYLVGVTEQGESCVSYTNQKVYMQDGYLFTNGEQVLTKDEFESTVADTNDLLVRVGDLEGTLSLLADNTANKSQIATLEENVATKADKASSLSGYGIADAYTIDECNTKFVASVNGITPKEGNVDIETITIEELEEILV